MKTNHLVSVLCSLWVMLSVSLPASAEGNEMCDVQQNKNRDREIFKRGYILPSDSLQVIPGLFFSPGNSTVPSLHSIEIRKNDTKVTFCQPIYFNSQWLYYSPGFTIIDKKTGDEYHVRGYDGCSSMDRVQIVQGFKNKYIYVSLIFPKLKKRVKYIDILELPHAQDKKTLPSNDDGIAKSYHNIEVKKYLIKTNKKEKKIYY